MNENELALVVAKAEAYDCLAQVQEWQQRLASVNQRVATLSRALNEAKEAKKT